MYRIYKIMDRQTKPDSLRASHILVSYTGTQIQGVTRSREAAEKVSDSIFNIVKSNPAALEAIAAAMSDDQGSKVKMGDLGWFADGAMVREFNKAVAEGAIGSVVKVESQFGFHILRVTGKKDPSVKIRVASVDRRIEPSAKTIEETYNKASAFAASNNTYEKFAKAAKDQGLNVRQQDRLTQNDGSIPGLKQARSVVQWAFNGDTEKGEVKFFETEGSYTVAALKYMVKPGIVPLEVIRESIKPLVVREKKAEIIMKKMTDLMAKQKDFAPIVNEYKVKIDTVDVSFVSANLPMHGHEPVVAGRIFAAKPGVFSAPLKGESGVYVFVLDSFKEAPETKDFNNQKKQMAMMFQGRANSVPSMLESKATIKDNRLMFF
jgi:parvulin-like peptidyl-prolyl isomerase